MAQRRKKLTQPEPGDLSDMGAASDTDGTLSMADDIDSADDEAAVSASPCTCFTYMRALRRSGITAITQAQHRGLCS